MTANSMTPVLAMVAKLPAGNPIRKAYGVALKAQLDFSQRGKLAWKTRRATKSTKGKTARKAK